MITRILLMISVYFLAPCFSVAQASPKAAPPSLTEIQVTLFGQTCLLSGPFDEKTLQTIHAISPEKIPPNLSLEQAKAAFTKLEASSAIPAALSKYREALMKRVDGQAKFLEALAQTKKSGKSALLIQAVSPFLAGKNLEEFKAKIKRLDATVGGNASRWNSTGLEQVTDAFHQALGAHPEEDFHRTIQRLKVQYTCSYGEPDPEAEEEE